MQTQQSVEAIKLQFPEVKFWMFVGRNPSKRIKGQVFPRNVAVPVWDRKTQILLRRLPYMKRIDDADLGLAPSAARKAIAIPENWRDLHHKRRISMARQISNEDIRSATRANEILAAHEQKKPAPESLTANG